jgi:septal ring factor EnvC (AmiA/AmiB activator)
MLKKNLSDLLRQETEKAPEGDRTLALEAQVKSLEEDLAAAHVKNQHLEAQVKALEAELTQASLNQQALDKELQNQQDLVKKLNTNLQNETKKPPSPTAPAPKPPQALPVRAKPPAITQKRRASYQAPSGNPIRLTNEDIGWFD